MKRTVLFLWMVLAGFVLNCSPGIAQKVFFTGLGRALVTNEKLKGNVLNGDTASPNKGTEGYVLFDLGINMHPYDFLKAKAVIRLKNTFGAFYGQGASVEFRQVLLEGLIAKKVKYALGDIDVKMTPYTVFNNEGVYTAYESDLFKIRRQIVYYENFNVNNNWRIQGAKAGANLLLGKGGSKIKLNGFISRTRPSNYYNLPDRFLAGGSIHPWVSDNFEGGINYVSFFDLRQSGTTAHYSNQVITGDIAAKAGNENFHIRAFGEGGYSLNNNYISTDTFASTRDFFYHANAEGFYKPWGLKLTAGYMQTGAAFYSPSAQTLRINNNHAPGIFPNVMNNNTVRGQLMFDRLTQENLYNQTILPGLMTYLPQYGNVLPYGAATPNRQGYVFRAEKARPDGVLDLSAALYGLTEIIGEGTTSLRKFHLLQGGGILRLNRLFNSERIIELKAGVAYEKTTREAPGAIALENNMTDAGIAIEFLKGIDLMGGYKLITSNGKEYLSIRNSLNQIQSYETFQLNFVQQVLGAGVRWRFTDRSFFTVHGNYTLLNDKLSEGRSNYSIRQYFVNYTLSF